MDTNLIVFDLDGVITGEEAYWDAAGLTLHELMYSPRYWNILGGQALQPNGTLQKQPEYRPVKTAQETRLLSRLVFSISEIQILKARAVNSNWDTCYIAVCLRLIELLNLIDDVGSLLPLRPWDEDWIADFRERMAQVPARKIAQPALGFIVLEAPLFKDAIGLEIEGLLDLFASRLLNRTIEDVFGRTSPFWNFCRNLFQEWVLGDALYSETYGRAPAQTGKPGCLSFEELLLPAEDIRGILEALKQQGYIFGIATGRARQEALSPLRHNGLLDYFDPEHISTYDDVEVAESELRASNNQTLLSKPHRFPFLYAAEHRLDVAFEAEPRPFSGAFVAVGDSTSDIFSARDAGGLTIAVLTGAHTPEARRKLIESRPDNLIVDVSDLPATLARLDDLLTIQKLQFTEREKAQRLLLRWFGRHLHLAVERVRLIPKPVSLNSFNGFYHADGEDFFFKTHVEDQGILAEYYHAELLKEAGYNIVLPARTLHEGGQQMVVYPVMNWPVMFDLLYSLETDEATDVTLEQVLQAELREDEHLLNIYHETAQETSAIKHAEAPIHQLFWHRLAGERYNSFYQGRSLALPGLGEASLSFEELLKKHWVINGVEQPLTLGELVERGRELLHPEQDATTVIGHGDAHFGNVFLEEQERFLYFDPAFSGRHSVLLDIVKPLFHNIFATWMYFPLEVSQKLNLSVEEQGERLIVNHNYTLTPLRQAILRTKVEHLLEPLQAWLRADGRLPEEWDETLKLALMCCPLLTINLLDRERLPLEIGWLGFLFAVQMGNTGLQPWREEL